MKKNTGKRFGRKFMTAAAAVLAAALLAGCGSGEVSYDKSEMLTQQAGAAADTAAQMYEGEYGMEANGADSVQAPSEEAVSEETGSGLGNGAASDRKLIRTVNMEVETREYDTFLDSLQQEVRSRGGYIENMDSYNGSSYSGGSGSRHANLTIRIPKDSLDGFLDMVSGAGNVVRRYENVEDVTLSYVDLASHRDALRTEQERLLALLERAESLEDIITLENRLSDVRYQLESMESKLRTIDNQVDYSTLSLNVTEVREFTPVVEQNVWERIAEGFSDSMEDIGDAAVEIMVWFLVNSPYLILFLLFFAAIIIIIKLGWRSSMKKAARQREAQEKAAREKEAREKAAKEKAAKEKEAQEKETK